MRPFSFKHKVLLLAVALVMAIQLVTLFPVLDAIKRDVDQRAEQTVGLAGVLFDEYMRNRTEQLLTTVNVLVSDYGFKQAVAGGDIPTIRSALVNSASRVGAPVAVLLDPDGRLLVSSTADDAAVRGAGLTSHGAALETMSQGVVYFNGVPYHTVTVPLRAPVTVAWVMLGFPIDEALARHLQSLTTLSVSFLRFAGDSPAGACFDAAERRRRHCVARHRRASARSAANRARAARLLVVAAAVRERQRRARGAAVVDGRGHRLVPEHP